MPVPVSMQGTVAFSTQARIRPAPPRGMRRSTRPLAVISSCAEAWLVSSTMFTDMTAIDKYICYTVRSFETKEKTLALPFGTNEQFLFIITDSPFIVDLSGQSILCIPGMGQIYSYFRPFLHLMRESELPVVV